MSLEKRTSQLQLLTELNLRLQSLMANSDFYQQLVQLIQEKFHYYCIHIWSVSDNQVARLEAQAGAYDGHLRIGAQITRGEGILGQVIRTRQAYLSNDVSTDPNYTNLSLPIHTKSELTVPVISQSDQSPSSSTSSIRSPNPVLAVLNVESDQTGAFDEDDLMTLSAVASQIAVAIQNQKLYHKVTSFNATLKDAVEAKTQALREANERILEQQKLLQKENKNLKALVQNDQKFHEFVGQSPVIRSLLTMVDKIAPTTATVIIQGESGTGKELIARRLHQKSDRSDRPYVTINCGALQESLLESELFGHEKGSFTGAIQQKTGLCEMADSGTLFLDEIGEVSPSIQTKLLRFLQEGEFYRIGGKRPIRVDVRIVCATNRDLEHEVKEGRFREDLFYRLNTITLRMPPLRKRLEDIPALVEFFLRNSRFGGTQSHHKTMTPEVIEIFQSYEWPGNIRELQNTVERLKILSESSVITPDDLPFNIRTPRTPKSKLQSDPAENAVDMRLEEVEKNHILKTLALNQGNKTRSASALGITIKTLYNKLHRYGVLKEGDSDVTQGHAQKSE